MTMTATVGTAVTTTPTDEQILITREFNAPRHIVYKAWTTPEIVMKWWSGKQGTMTSVEIDLRVGGRWRYVMDSDGAEVAFHGVYREIVPNERLVNTEVYEMPGVPEPEENEAVVNIADFEATATGTHLSLLVQCPNREVRDMILGSGMEVGMQEQMDALEVLAQEMAHMEVA
jgi:uncharacterized protein YndB with AHSA1/START domain